MLEVRLTKRLGETAIDIAFTSAGPVTALSGPSGAGKTSILNMIAGLLPPDDGLVVWNGETLYDRAKRIDVPVHRRRIGYVFQDGRLLPHLSVARNLDYGRWMNGLPRDPANEAQIVDLLDIGSLKQRRIGALSGGERQRIAIGRAMLSRPRLMLLDEPLSSLDEARKAEILPYLLRLKSDFRLPMVYVSHVETEIDALADKVITIRAGQIV